MSKYKIVTAALILCLLAIGVCAWFMFGSSAGLTYANADKYTAGDTTVTEPVRILYVDWTEGAVNIEYHSGSGIVISETADKALSENDKLRWWLDGDTLRIRYARSDFRISAKLNKKLTVSLPEGTVLNTADLSVTSAEMNIPDLVADEIRLDSTSGDITAVTATKKLTASATSGDMRITQAGEIGDVNLFSTSGSIECVLTGARGVYADSTSGAISLTLSEGAEKVRAGSTSGNVYADTAFAGKADLSSTSGSVIAKVASFGELKIHSTSGAVTAYLPEKPGFTCSVDTTSGSFGSGIALAKDGKNYVCGDGSAKCVIDTTSGDVRIEGLQ